MARDVESLVLQMSADLRRFEKSMDAAKNAADRRLNDIEKRAKAADRKLSKTMGDAGRNMVGALKQNLSGLAPVLAGAFSTAAVIGMADSFTQMQNRLKTTGLDAKDLASQFAALNAVADASRSPIEAVVAVYSRLRLATEGMAFSNAQITETTEILSKALKASGATAQETSSALLQFGQAIGSGVLQGDELRSIRENAPAVARAIAKEFGVTVGELKKLGEEGKLTSERVLNAVLASGQAINATFALTEATVGDALTNLQNKLTNYIGLTDESTSATDRIRQAINLLADNLETVTTVVGILAAIMGTKYVLALSATASQHVAATVTGIRYQLALAGLAARQGGVTTATVLSTAATRAFTAAIVANPIGAAIVAITALAAGVYLLNQRFSESAVASRELKAQIETGNAALGAYEEAQIKARDASKESAAAARENAAAMREEAQAAIVAARALSAKRVAEAQEAVVRAQNAAQTAARREPRQNRSRGEQEMARGARFASDALYDEQNRAQSRAGEAIREQIRQEQEFQRISAGINLGGVTAPTLSPTTENAAKDKAARGTSPEDLARQRAILDLQAEISLLRAQDRNAEADAQQDALDLLNLTKQYDDAGFENARAKAQAQVSALATARTAAQLAEEAKRQAEGEARAIEMTRGFVLDMLSVQEQLALTDRDALEVRREILAIRQAERRAALEAAAADIEATDAERAAARSALGGLGGLERGERQEIDSSSEGARDARGIIADMRGPENAVERAREAYAEIDALRQQDVISEAEAARAKAQVDVDLQDARLSGTRAVLGALETLQNSSNKKLAALGKAAAITQATIDGYLAIQKAWSAFPYPFNLPGVAATTVAVGANVAAIAGLKDGGPVRGPGGPRDDKVLMWGSNGEFMMNARATAKNRPFLEAANAGADLSKMLPALANGGMVGRVNQAAARVSSAAGQAATTPVTFSPTINAPGADMATARQIRADLDDMARNLPGIINGVREKRARYRLGKNSQR